MKRFILMMLMIWSISFAQTIDQAFIDNITAVSEDASEYLCQKRIRHEYIVNNKGAVTLKIFFNEDKENQCSPQIIVKYRKTEGVEEIIFYDISVANITLASGGNTYLEGAYKYLFKLEKE